VVVLQGVGGAEVQPCPSRGGELCEHGVPDELMTEDVRARSHRVFGEQPGFDRLLNGIERDVVGCDPRNRSHAGDRDAAAEDRGGDQRLPAIRGQRTHPQADGGAQAAGERRMEPLDELLVGNAARVLGERDPHHLCDEQRVAAGAGEQICDEPRRRTPPDLVSDELRECRRGESLEREQRRRVRPAQGAECLRQRIVEPRFVVAQRGDDDDAPVAQPRREEREQRERVRVGGVQVVQHDEQRLARRGPDEA
jgi:hypothetical protein